MKRSCKKCHKDKPLSEFTDRRGYSPRLCDSCKDEQREAKKVRDKDRIKGTRWHDLFIGRN
jgi:hypothetical protein